VEADGPGGPRAVREDGRGGQGALPERDRRVRPHGRRGPRGAPQGEDRERGGLADTKPATHIFLYLSFLLFSGCRFLAR
jgi:hypothetical protein